MFNCLFNLTRNSNAFGIAVLIVVLFLSDRVNGDSSNKRVNTEAGDPLAASEAVIGFKVPAGFEVSLFAAEPHVQQPIAITTDERGRLWVAENYTYAEAATNFDEQQQDRIVILEDTNNDGKFDKRKVFWDGASKLTSVEVGHGGVWALCAPNLLFIPDRDRDDVPDGPPQVMLDGWDDDVVRHNIVNGLKWGPDGWLYGRHGILATSSVGKPGDTASQRQQMNCGIWRYHPVKQLFEIVAHGTTNPWGFDYDDHGQMFFINTVIGHLWHVVPGAHYRRMFGGDLNPYVYELVEQCADHFHWDTGEAWNDVQKGVTDTTSQAGGGHAHSGLMIYLGDNWPDSYRNSVYTLNFHGRRLNNDILVREGASYVGQHGADLLFAKDEWFRGIDLIYGPDGGVFIADWSDTGECHESDGIHRTSGRIYKVTYGKPTPVKYSNLAEMSDLELVKLQLHKNDWYVRQSRRLLHERAVAGKDMSQARKALEKLFVQERDDTRQLRALWCLHLIDDSNQSWLQVQLDHPSEHVRLWAVRFLSETNNVSEETLARFTAMANEEESALVRLFLASIMQRLPLESRWLIAEGLVNHQEDSADPNLPLIIWYGIEAAIPTNLERAVALAEKSSIPLVRRLIARRITSDLESNTEAVNQLLQLMTLRMETDFQMDLLKGMNQAMQGRRKAPMPAAWPDASKRLSVDSADSVQEELRQLGVIFGDGRAISELHAIALDQEADVESRRSALRALVGEGGPKVLVVLKLLLNDFALSNEAVRGFAFYDDPQIPRLVLGRYDFLDPTGKAIAIDTLTSRPSYAQALLSAAAAGTVNQDDITAYHARQLQSFDDETINAELKNIWGSIRETSTEKKKQIQELRALMTPERLMHSDPSQGRQLFAKSCSNCHVLYGVGSSVGPDLTGSNRHNLTYLLENIIDPSASVNNDYRVSLVLLEDGRVVSGVIVSHTPHTITVRTQTEKITLDRKEVEEVKKSESSLMPDGVLTQLSQEQICDLFTYLMGRSQTPLPEDFK